MRKIKCKTCNGAGEVNDPVALGRDLRSARRAADITLRELGDILGYSGAHLCDIEHGRRRCKPALRY